MDKLALLTGPLLLSKNHRVEFFDCGVAVLNDYLKKYALQNQQSQGARSYVVTRAENVVGFFTLAYGSVSPDETPPRVLQGLGRYPVPLLVLARLAVDKREQGQGLGKALLKNALLKAQQAAEIVGLRAVLVNAKDDNARNFYEYYGFLPSPFDAYSLYLLMKDIRKTFIIAKQESLVL